jgi:2,4-dienoyl-CoA reductase-like NADH-dependent reductase (Old Yellow Enzyme family)
MLLSRFLSPAFNRRADRYGGAPENCVRIVSEIANEVRRAAGPKFLISAKVNGRDYVDGGVTPELCAEYVRLLRPSVDLIEISGGAADAPFACRAKLSLRAVRSAVRPAGNAEQVYQFMEERYEDVPYEEGFNIAAARDVRRLAPRAAIAVCGGLRRFAQMEEIVRDGTADIVSLSRPFLREPDLIAALRSGADAKCIHCGLCQNAGRGVNCLHPTV